MSSLQRRTTNVPAALETLWLAFVNPPGSDVTVRPGPASSLTSSMTSSSSSTSWAKVPVWTCGCMHPHADRCMHRSGGRHMCRPPTTLQGDGSRSRCGHRRRNRRCQCRLPPGQGRLGRRPPAREGRADERLDPPCRGARDGVQPVADDDAVPPLLDRALRGAGRVRARGQRADRVERGEPDRPAPGREPGCGDRPGRRADLARRGARADAPRRRGRDLRRRLDGRRRARRPAHRDARGR